ncbi:periplasmic heavy metal sensor [candidate division KSB3 bacterium]|uniref:Periplasmic heavy metal sensor n=1 Tax=candidate division KSB3 bacterium TaxID=2044937 RepID=A0A9D5JSQ0_9BACT|nr:periplasmic heavy metal sensor [candidate division KSB3 bacterium]MBD3323286.1 periplasmic heavy metal sensor [candidate division KSB3 bacterium]
MRQRSWSQKRCCMNYFSRQRITRWTIGLLILLNLSTLALLWRSHMTQPAIPLPPQDGRPVEQFLQQELGLTEAQMHQFEEVRQQHFQQTKGLVDAIQQLKREAMEEVFAASPDSARLQAIAEEIGAMQAEIEALRFAHFLELAALFEPEQQETFRALLHEISPPQQRPEPDRPPQPGDPPHQPGGPPEQRHQPPQAAINACAGKEQGSACQFHAPSEIVTGTCRTIGDHLACVPAKGAP